MAQRRHHYELAFERFLRERKLPYLAVDEARRAVLPDAAELLVTETGARIGVEPGMETGAEAGADSNQSRKLKAFDFVVYGKEQHLLCEIKGRKIAAPKRRKAAPTPRSKLQSWVTLDDVECLRLWERLFGSGYRAAFVFLYWCDAPPPDELFQESFESDGRWYAVRAVTLGDYTGAMKPRSARWNTVHIPTARFQELSQPFAMTEEAPGDRNGPRVSLREPNALARALLGP